MNKVKFFLAILIGFIVLQTIFYYRGIYLPPPSEMYRAEINVSPLPATGFLDVYEGKRGVVIFDFSHENDYELSEVNVLQSMLISRGQSVEYLRDVGRLEDALKYADSMVVILPTVAFTKEEIELVKGFIEKGGRLLLVSDPTRDSEINSLSSNFGIVFEDDYLYNLKENDGNYRNIFIKNFRINEVTRKLEKIALYTAHSIRYPGGGIAFTDENTFSSLREAKGTFSPMVLAENNRILAIGDMTFMTEPFNTVLDNNQLIANIANYLGSADRRFYLSDFPYYFNDVDVIYKDASLLKSAIELKNVIGKIGRNAMLRDSEDLSKDTVFLGYFDDAEEVSGYLQSGGISVDSYSIKIKYVGELSKDGIALLYLYENAGRHVLIILSDTQEEMEDATLLLESGNIEDNLITEVLGIAPIAQPADEGLSGGYGLEEPNASME